MTIMNKMLYGYKLKKEVSNIIATPEKYVCIRVAQ